MKSNLNDAVIDEFLNAQTKEGTFKSYKTVMKQYLEYTGKTGQQLIELENALLESQRKITALETTNEVLRKRVDELENGQNTTKEMIGSLSERITYIEKKTKIKKPTVEEIR